MDRLGRLMRVELVDSGGRRAGKRAVNAKGLREAIEKYAGVKFKVIA
jgi:hypothetical protein